MNLMKSKLVNYTLSSQKEFVHEEVSSKHICWVKSKIHK